MNDRSPAFNSRIMKIYLEYLRRYYPDMDLDAVLEYAGMTRHDVEDQAHWYSQEQADRFYGIVTEKTGNPNIARQAGRYATSSEGLGFMKQYALGLMRVESVYLLMERLYSRMSRGASIRVKKLGPQRIEIVATPTPGIHEKLFQCENRMGMFESVAKLFTKQIAKIEHPQCFHRGDRCCRYLVTWDKDPSLVLKRLRNYSLLLGIVAVPAFLAGLSSVPGTIASLVYIFLAGGLSLLTAHLEKRELVRTIQTQGDAAENAIKEMKARYDHAVLVQEAGRTTSTVSRVDRMLDAVVRVMDQHLDDRMGVILLADPKGTRLRYASSWGLSKEQRVVFRETEFFCDPGEREKVLWSTLAGKTPPSLTDVVRVQQGPGSGTVPSLSDLRPDAFLCIPIVYQGEFVGVLGLDRARSGGPLTKTDLNVMMGISSQIAAGIVNATSFQALKESERNYRELVESSRSIILRLDLQGRVTFVNEFSQGYLGTRDEEMLGKRNEETILFDREWPFDEVANLLLQDPSRHISSESEIQLRSEDSRWLAWTYLPILDKEGQVKEILYVGNDITKLKTAEVESQRAKEASEAASRAKDEFLANMSHEIRTPIHGLLGMTDLLQSTALNAKQQRLVASLRSSGGALLAVIDDILDLSSMEAGRLKMQSVPFGLRRTVEEVIEMLTERAHQKGLELFCQVDKRLPDTFRGDPTRLRQILRNLVSNGIKFTERGEVIVRVVPVEEWEDKIWLRFEVKDTGLGVPAELHSVIFEPFAQADGSAARTQGGTGLGLTITKRICERMGGEIHVESVPGKGSTFSFVLPLEKEVESSDCLPSILAEPSEGKIPSEETQEVAERQYDARVLLVEDNRVNQELAVSMLENLGCRVGVAWNGLEALEQISATRFDLVLMDCQMPLMDGYEATERIRRKEETGDGRRNCLPVIALTAHAMEGDRDRCLAAGMDDYLPKPFTQDQLTEVLDRWLERTAATRGGPAETDEQDLKASSDAETEPVSLDRKALEAIRALQRQGKPDLLTRVINVYLEDSLRLLEALRQAVSKEDASDVKRQAHSLKSSSANVGALRLSTLCKELERMDGGDSSVEGCQMLSRIETEYASVRDALSREIERNLG